MRAVIAAIVLCGSASVVKAEPVTFSLRFVVAEAEGERVVSDAWIARHVQRANELFEPAQISFVTASLEGEPEMRADLVTRAHRHQLSPSTEREVINVFVVRSMADVDVQGEFIRGVHWRSRRGCDGEEGCQRHYCILSSIAGSYTLAHELGHFFGNPHSPTPGNIMSYTRAEGPPFFDAGQLRRIARFRRRFLESGELLPR